jgi:hypothetical protein
MRKGSFDRLFEHGGVLYAQLDAASLSRRGYWRIAACPGAFDERRVLETAADPTAQPTGSGRDVPGVKATLMTAANLRYTHRARRRYTLRRGTARDASRSQQTEASDFP